ncbi:MAG: hypothetical protein GTO55_04230 [Armatimonadetes bacterium]|nr:hypothetical protein [Armatimonadota bacterium]NIM23479.1 hypothetical protein [Armatimonadota bacterium]NIM67345.1 hypothetical protein [Armatimonadota bacterium]NIM75846.1 hypothetical protein [Armatimonadota bacterium]NIN05531.1 hypothetical protein [Armatimonadota bacterium]
MKQAGWLVTTLPMIALLVSLAVSQEQARLEEVGELISGGLLVRIDEFNEIPIGRGGFSTGFAFAPGRPELAYCAVEETDKGLCSVLRIVQVEKLWAVDRKSTRVYNTGSLEKEPRFEIAKSYAPFAERERELTRVEAAGKEGSLWGPFLEGPIAWSPDGARLAVYVVTEDASKSYASRDLWVVDYKTGQREILTLNMWVTAEAWSPNSRWLALVAEPANPELADLVTRPARPGLWLFDVQSGERKRIADGAISLEWSKDSSWLRFRRSGDSKEAQQYDTATSKLSSTPSFPPEARPWEISPDGRFIATMKRSMDGSRLEVRERSSGTLLVNVPAEAMGCWHPDNRLLAYFGPDGALMMTTVEGEHRGRAAKVTVEAEYNVPPFQAPLQWSSQSTLPQYREARQQGQTVPTPEPMMSWFALISKGKLCVLCMDHENYPRPPSASELAALRRLDEKEETMLVLANIKQIGMAVLMYAGDNDGQAPPSGPKFFEAVRPYVSTTDIFDRPGYPNQPVFRYLLPGGFDLEKLKMPVDVPIAVIDYWGDQGVVAFADGHASWIRGDGLEKVLRKGEELLSQAAEKE